MKELPPWVVLHVPHDSTEIPEFTLTQFVLNEAELRTEVLRMTDHHTLALFASQVSNEAVVRASVSRLVVDVERFVEDKQEPMHERGMGVIYMATSDIKPLRRSISPEEREALRQSYYQPHHKELETVVKTILEIHNRCLIIDCHSFPNTALPYELADPNVSRPEICIGTDNYHTSKKLSDSFMSKFKDAGWIVKLDNPFSGALVPMSRYRCDSRVSAIMLEVNRRLYMDETDAEKQPEFQRVRKKIRAACVSAINECKCLKGEQ